MIFLRRMLLTIVIAYLIVLAVIRIFETRFIFFPDYRGRLAGNWNPQLPIEKVRLHTSDGVEIHAWWIPARQAKFTFIAFHGNAGNIANRAEIYRFLHELPVNVLAVEYRGYGLSQGTPSENGIYRDAEAGLVYLQQIQQINSQTIICYGQSLGTAVAAHLAAAHKLGGVVLEAPFPSASAMARKVFWFLPGLNLVVLGQFDTVHQVTEIGAPLLVVHCTQDPVIPPEMGEKVFAAAHQPKAIFRVNGYCHEEAALIAPQEYRAQLNEFLAGIMETRP